MRKLYLTGPAVLHPDAQAISVRLKAFCRSCGFEGFWAGDDRDTSSQMIFVATREAIRRVDAVIADIGPFRGPHADVGTAFQIGLAYQAGIPVFAHTGAFRPNAEMDAVPLIDRIWFGEYAPRENRRYFKAGEDGRWRDKDGFEVENFGHAECAMIFYAIRSLTFSAVEAICDAADYFERADQTGRAHA
jgi:nucleoside 2-deoxyribosyltransferase